LNFWQPLEGPYNSPRSAGNCKKLAGILVLAR
jgi:hypothetical protein